jgi:hypothetical protein
MNKIPTQQPAVKLPLAELKGSLDAFVEPMSSLLPDKRLRRLVRLGVQGILAGQSPRITQIARGVAHSHKSIWPLSKRLYRFLYNRRCRFTKLRQGLYRIAQQEVAKQAPAYLLISLDPVNFEKPYTHKLEGISTVHKATPPGPKGKARLTAGYPAITATIVNLPLPAICYCNWFSYTKSGYGDHNYEIYRAIRTSRFLFGEHTLRFVGDAGLDDQKIFAWVERVRGQFIIRSQKDRRVEVYNERLCRFESGLLQDLAGCLPLPVRVSACFRHARKKRWTTLQMGWLSLRFVENKQPFWALVIQDTDKSGPIILLTNLPLTNAQEALQVYKDWSQRPKIEHTYRFDQEEGLTIEDVRVRTIERMRRVMVLVLLAALFVYHLSRHWPKQALLWLRLLGGKLGLSTDRDGVYVLLAGIRAVLVTWATLQFAKQHPFPLGQTRYG